MSEGTHSLGNAARSAPALSQDDGQRDRSHLDRRRGPNDLPDLSGRRILVVEDSYFIAADIAGALSAAGAQVLGPCPTEKAACDLLVCEALTHAVIDLNLDEAGPRFHVAHLLKAHAVPFIIVTGYDGDVITPEFCDIPCLQKPLSDRVIVRAIGGV